MSVLEAMATGTPVVVSSGQDSILDLVSDGISAMIFDTDDVNQLANIICQLNDDPALRKRLSRGAKAAVAERLRDDGVSAWGGYNGISSSTDMNGEK